MTYNVLMGTLNPTHSLTFSLTVDQLLLPIQAVQHGITMLTLLGQFQRKVLCSVLS